MHAPITEDDLWQDAAAAFCETRLENDDCEEADVGARVVHNRLSIFRLADGDIHVCNERCQLVEAGLDAHGRPNGDMVCSLTGRVISRTCEVRTDFSTGRYSVAFDSDRAPINAGVARGGSLHRLQSRDMRRASAAAFEAAARMDDTTAPYNSAISSGSTTSTQAHNKKHTKEWRASRRAAVCITEAGDVARPSRLMQSVHTFKPGQQLLIEASVVLTKIVLANRTVVSDASASCSPSRHVEYNTLHSASLQKYLAMCKKRNVLPSDDDIGKISASVQKVVAETNGAAVSMRAAVELVNDVAFRELVCELCATVFVCSLNTPYIKSCKRSKHSFRQLCTGVCYMLKRGMALPTGSVIIPKCDTLVPLLSSSRNSNMTKNRKALHSSSYRGVCMLHRSIASVPLADVEEMFSNAALVAGRLASLC